MVIPEKGSILSVVKETHDAKTFRVRVPHPFRCLPGQFAEISVFGFGEAPFSFSSLPSLLGADGEFEITVKKVGSVSSALHHLGVGGAVGVRGPFGKGYPLDEFEGKELVIVGGGIGLAPLKPLIEIFMKKLPVKLFYGARTPDDIVFGREMERWAGAGVKCNVTVDKGGSGWKGAVGVVTRLIDDSSFDPANSVVAICGPPVMIRFSILSLQKKGFSDSKIWVSLERKMQCGMGKCGHCAVSGRYVCMDGPVFRFDEAKQLID